MLMLAKLIGVAIIAMGTVIAINGKAFTAMLDFWKKGKNMYLAGILRLAFGTLFVYISHLCRLPAVMSVLGILTIIGGVLIFVMGPKKILAMIEWFQKMPPLMTRAAGLVAIMVGALIVYSI